MTFSPELNKWNDMDRNSVRANQAQMLQTFLKKQVIPFCKNYRELFKTQGIDPDQIRSLDDLRRIPFTSKKDLLSSPEQPQCMMDFLIRPDEKELSRRPSVVLQALLRGRAHVKEKLTTEYRPIFLTSTTGRSAEPVPFLYTGLDLENLSRAGRHMISILGATRDDRIINMFPFAPHLAFWLAHYATTSCNIFCVSSGGGKVMGTEGNIRLMTKLKPTALIGMPTFIYHLLRQALHEGHRCDKLRILVLGGEKVPDGMRQKLRNLAAELGSPNVNIVPTYGFTEAKMAWPECCCPSETPSGYHLYPDLGLVEVINPKTGELCADGEGGEIVFTPLNARGTVVLRYRTGDCIEGGLVYEPCPSCGRRLPRLIGNISRRSDVVEMQLDKIKGTIVDFNTLEHVLDNMTSIGSWQLELRKADDDPLEVDELILHAEKLSNDADDKLIDEINERFTVATELRLNKVFFHHPGEMQRRQGVGVELKEKRLVDHRPKTGKPPPPRTTASTHAGTHPMEK